MSTVIAIAHVLSVSIILLEYSFGKLICDSNTLPTSGSIKFSADSVSRSPVSLAIFNFSKMIFQFA